MPVRGVRGATCATENTKESILGATRELLQALQEANGLDTDDIAAIWFTVTADLDAAFPAQAARQLGWEHVPLMDACEIPVPNSLARCIRVLLLWNTERSARQVVHIYQGEAQKLRPDLVNSPVNPKG